MAIYQVLGSDKILRMNDFELLGLVQSEDWAPNFNAEDIFEMGKESRLDSALELEVSGSLELQSIGGTAGLLARAIVTRTGSAFTGYLFSATNQNNYNITQSDFREMEFDLIMHEQPDHATFTRSVILPRCFISSISGRADANGSASETINFQGDFVIGAVDPYHDVRAVPATIDEANDQLDLLDAGVTSATHTIMYAYIGGWRLRTTTSDDTYVAFDGATASVDVLDNGATAHDVAPYVTETARVIVYKTSGSATFPSISTRTTSSYYVRGWQATIWIAPANDSSPTNSEKWLRVQNIDWTIDTRLEALRQIEENVAAGNAVYYRAPLFPLDVTVNATVLETDWADWKAVLDGTVKTFPGNNVYADTYDFAPASLDTNFSIRIDYYTKAGTLLQTWKFTDCRVDGYGNRANIGGRGEITWSFKGTSFDLQGYNA